MPENCSMHEPNNIMYYNYNPLKKSTITYSDDKRKFDANLQSSNILAAGVGMLAGAAIGIYIYKKYFKD
jgi:hypothetical protein